MIHAPLANDSSRVAKNTTNITTKHFTSLRSKEEENRNWNKTSTMLERKTASLIKKQQLECHQSKMVNCSMFAQSE